MPARMDCSVTGCERPARRLGYCNVHYQAYHKYGDPLEYRGNVPRERRATPAKLGCLVCDKAAEGEGLCKVHLERLRLFGDPYRGRTLADRLWSRIDKNGPLPSHCPELGRCWVWTGGRNEDGYGQIGITTAKHTVRCVRVHRLVWELVTGSKPTSYLCHRCDNPPCVRPAHLFEGTAKDNAADMVDKGRSPRRRFTDSEAAAVRTEFATGCWTIVAFARHLSVSTPTLTALLVGKTYSRAGGPLHQPSTKDQRCSID